MEKNKSNLFLMELMICILFFALASAVCIQMFAKASRLSQSSVDESHAVGCAQSAASAFFSGMGESEAIAGFYPYADVSADGLTQYYGADWQECSVKEYEAGNAAYRLELTVSREDSMVYGHIRIGSCGSDSAPIYELTVRVHSPNRLETSAPVSILSRGAKIGKLISRIIPEGRAVL